MQLSASLIPTILDAGKKPATKEELESYNLVEKVGIKTALIIYPMVLALVYTVVFVQIPTYLFNILEFVLYIWLGLSTLLLPLVVLTMVLVIGGNTTMLEHWIKLGKQSSSPISGILFTSGFIYQIVVMVMLASGGYYYCATLFVLGIILLLDI